MIIGFSGKRGVGKTTAARFIAMNYGYKLISFAEQLKKVSAILFPFEFKHLYGVESKEKPFDGYDWTPREFLIKFGSFMRYWDEDYWIKYALRNVGGNIVIDDIRYKNEAQYLRKEKAILIRINRWAKDNPYKEVINDPSETDLDDYGEFSYKINEVENMSISSLQFRLNNIMDQIQKK